MQTIAWIRIDERLIHGQVATAWVRTVDATRIMVVDDNAAHNEMQIEMLKAARPTGVKLSVLPIRVAIRNLLSGKYANDRVFILVKSVDPLTALWQGGVKFDTVNIGNRSVKPDSVPLKRTFNVTKDDVKQFCDLLDDGVKFDTRMVPNEKPQDFEKLIGGVFQ